MNTHNIQYNRRLHMLKRHPHNRRVITKPTSPSASIYIFLKLHRLYQRTQRPLLIHQHPRSNPLVITRVYMKCLSYLLRLLMHLPIKEIGFDLLQKNQIRMALQNLILGQSIPQLGLLHSFYVMFMAVVSVSLFALRWTLSKFSIWPC